MIRVVSAVQWLLWSDDSWGRVLLLVGLSVVVCVYARRKKGASCNLWDDRGVLSRCEDSLPRLEACSKQSSTRREETLSVIGRRSNGSVSPIAADWYQPHDPKGVLVFVLPVAAGAVLPAFSARL